MGESFYFFQLSHTYDTKMNNLIFTHSPYSSTLCKIHWDAGFLLSIYSHIWNEYVNLRAVDCIFLCSHHMWEDTQKIKPVFWCNLCSATSEKLVHICFFLDLKHFIHICKSDCSNLIEDRENFTKRWKIFKVWIK